MFWKTENKLESKKEFFSKVEKHFTDLSVSKIPENTLNELSEYISNLIYKYYKDCWKKYPKSRKRYSELKIEDLDNLFYQHRIFDFLKSKTETNFIEFTCQLLGLNETEFIEFEKRKNQFENM
ncbi:hypothetical protein DIS18_01415 [Algibacter marinivivus]|uniref:Uncharacterized protein n=1 Tax=Algibacter marinivivus TaxID=2100723 RepID=A0A2U2X624_9FLAO|nr:hypothetical protein [Algibacter marinivivus]PWH83238.1 hypothetical protein DIS18_01415 [Algibacter marinivivus]